MRVYGQLARRCCGRWAAWDLRFGILERPLDVERAFDTTLVTRQRNP